MTREPGTSRRRSLLLAIFHNFGSAVGSKVVSMLLGIVTYGIMARTLGTAGLGRYRTALTLLLFTGVLVEFGVYAITLRDMSQPDADVQRILGVDVPWFVASAVCAPTILGSVLLLPRVRQILAPLGAA